MGANHMGGKKPRRRRRKAETEATEVPTRKPGREKLSEVVAGLSDPDADAVARVRKIASALELEKVVNILDAGEDVMSAVREVLRRGEGRYTVAEAAEKAG